MASYSWNQLTGMWLSAAEGSSARGRLCVLLQSLKESPGAHQNTPAGPQHLAQHIHGYSWDFSGAVCRWFSLSGPAGFWLFVLEVLQRKGKGRETQAVADTLWLSSLCPRPQQPQTKVRSVEHRPQPHWPRQTGLTRGHWNLHPFKHLNPAFFFCSIEQQMGRFSWDIPETCNSD